MLAVACFTKEQGMTNPRSIILTADEVRAVLDTGKVQVRRAMKPQPEHAVTMTESNGRWYRWLEDTKHLDHANIPSWVCPFGRPGDGLWVRETWGVFSRKDGGARSDWPGTWVRLAYKADVEDGVDADYHYVKVKRYTWNHWRELVRWQRWNSSATMPSWASRLNVTPTSVRVELLQGISYADMAAVLGLKYVGTRTQEFDSEVRMFRAAWDKSHSKSGERWSDNPHVWVGDFERVGG